MQYRESSHSKGCLFFMGHKKIYSPFLVRRDCCMHPFCVIYQVWVVVNTFKNWSYLGPGLCLFLTCVRAHHSWGGCQLQRGSGYCCGTSRGVDDGKKIEVCIGCSSQNPHLRSVLKTAGNVILIFSTGENSSRHYSILSFSHADHSFVKMFLADNQTIRLWR